ncbi:MAG: alpha-mannosidase [Candidatus Hydrogenedentes bacterium]|nr:alpha-mannosidase [Candidatus Hydrogenedentota bacterium]
MLPPKIIEKLGRRIEKLRAWRYAVLAEVPLEEWETDEHLRTPPEGSGWAPAPVGSTFGAHWNTTWFRAQIEIPREARGRRVFYRHRSHTDKLLWVDGAPFAGMNHAHEEVLLHAPARGGETHLLHVEAYTGHPIPGFDAYAEPRMYTHQFTERDPGVEPPLPLECSALVCEREAVAGLFFDADVLYRTARMLDENSLRRAKILSALNNALNLVPMQWADEAELEAAAAAARKALAPALALKNGPTAPRVGIAGHCHIDIGWLWPVRESIRKAAKSFSTVLNLMDQYPGFRFQQSQPWLYDVIETHYPALLPKIQKRVKEGRWEPNGGMWVEADCNVPSGESLVRQFLEGRKKTRELFGYTGDTLWLPDVFGYSAALPQILRKSGIQNFVTSKINWGDTNRFPYDTFLWEGIDGTQIFTHYINTMGEFMGYNAPVLPEASQHVWNRVQHKEVQDATLSSVGWGDGGGGPTREMCEYAARMADLEGCVRTEWVNVSEFLRELREAPARRPVWSGELYLEYHRGTYTAQARTKRYNRKLEFLLREVELYASMAMPFGAPYPAATLESYWRVLLTNQFHDIIPGSSIRRVYEVAEAEYARLEEKLTALKSDALAALAGQLIPDAEGRAWIVANPLSWNREDLALIPDPDATSACDGEGRALPCQKTPKGLAVRVRAGSLSVAPIALRDREPEVTSPFRYSGKGLETPHYTIAFDKAGRIKQLVDKEANRDIVQPGAALNQFYTAEDMPLFWDAWDIDRYYRDHVQTVENLESRELLADGPLFLAIRSAWKIGRRSRLVQDMHVYAHTRRIDFKTRVDWREERTLLKAGFPLDIHAPHIRAEIQFGHVLRNLHENTSWDRARFEACAHKWVDLSEGDYGVALLNDCKYGYDTLDGMLSLTLLRSPRCPDEQADIGAHEFTYALLPHHRPFAVESVVREAYALNAPLTAAPGAETGGAAPAIAFCQVSNPKVLVEAVKKAEADNAVIIRLYEAGNTRGPVEISFGRPVKKAVSCNLMEEEDTPLKTRDDTAEFNIAPFEIKTLKVYFR